MWAGGPKKYARNEKLGLIRGPCEERERTVRHESEKTWGLLGENKARRGKWRD